MKLLSKISIYLSFSLAALPLFTNAASAQAAPLFMPTRFTVVDEGAIGKPEVVLIPGLNSSRAVWEIEAAKLAPNYRLHLVQINGFAGQAAGPNAGETNLLPALVEELHHYLEARHIQPILMGHSIGGLLALRLAEQHPADVRRLVIVDTLPFYATMFAPDATAESTRPFAEQMKQQLASVSQEQYQAMQPAMAAQMSHDPAARKLIAAWSSSSDRGVMAEAAAEDLLTDARPGLPELKIPTLVLYEYDPTLAQPPAEAFEKLMRDQWGAAPGVTLVRMEGARHFIMYDQPEKFHAMLAAFLQ